MAGRRSIAALAVLLGVMQLAPLLPLAGARDISTFSDGSASADALLAAGGNATAANLSVPLSSVVLGCSLGVSTLAGAGWPLSPSLDIGGDGTVDWGFGGIGYGRFGSQDVFVDGASTKELRFIAPGNGTARLLLPKNATVEPASLDIEGFADQRWWNSSWRDRLPLTVRDLSGSNQTDFSVEVLLDTRNWTLASAEREFRVTSVNSTTLEETEVPLQVIDEIGNGSKCFEAGLVFAVRGLGANGSRTYHLYFNNPAASRSPDFSDFRPRLIKSRLADQPVQASFFGPLSGPAGACFDDGGNYWVADQGRMAVFGFTGTLGRPDAGGSDASRLRFPTDVAVRYDGKVIVSDRDNYRVQVFAPDGTLSFTLGATGSPGSDNSHFGLPGGVGTDGEGNIYVADTSVHRVQIFDRNGTWLDTIGAPGMPGSDNDHLYSPTGIWVSRTGNVLVADLGNQRVQAFARTGRASWSWNYTLGTTGVPGTDNDHFMSPMDVCQDGPGRTYVVDMANHRVQVFTGKVYKATLGVTGAPGPDSSHLTAPMGVAVSPSGRVFVSDTGAHRVQVFDSSYKYSQTLGNRSASCLGGPGTTDYAFDSPGGVAADASGRIYVSDTLNHRVQIFTALGGLAARLGQTGTPGYDPSHFMHPRGLEVGTDGRVFVADGGGHPPGTLASNHRVLVFFDLADGAADFQLGITGQPGNTSLNLNQPWDVSVNGAGRIAVADKGITLSGPMTFHQGTRVQLFNGLGDAAADYTLGVSGLPGMDSTRLSFPRGVGETEDGSVFVADTGNNRVVLFKNDGGASADLVLNPSGTAGSGQGQFRAPSDVDLDASGRIFVADTGNHRISVFDGSGVPLYILGETGVYGSDDRHLSGPEGLKVADDGKLYIADTGNHRVVRVSPASLDIGPVEGLAAPEDVSLDVGGDGSPEWERKGFLVGRSTVTGLGAAIDRALAGGTAQADAFGNGMVTVAVNLSNAGNGRITLSNLTIVYRCTLEASGLDRAIGDYVLLHAAEADAAGNVSVPVVCSASSAGGVTLGDLRLLVDMPPELLVPVPDRALDEDTSDPALYDLSEFFQDDLDAVLDYSLVNLTNATPNITLTPGGVLSVDCTAPPARDWNGVVEFSVRAADSRGLATVSNKVRLTVRPVNDPPDLTSSPPVIAARVGTEWSYDAAAHDPDGDRLTFTLETRPAGMTVDPASGRLSWTPSAADVGTHQVGLRVTDGFLSDRQNFSVNVAPAGATNRPPVISSTPVTAAGIGKRYVYQVVARDDDGDALAYSLETAPSGMTVGEANGTVEWVPLASQEGRHEVVVRVHDGNVAVTQGFNLTVTSGAVDLLPTVSITEPRAGASVGGKVWIRGTASARNATVERVEVSVDLDGRWVEAAGKTSWALRLDTAGLSNGRHTVFVRALDSAGNWGQSNITLDVRNVQAPPPASDAVLGLPLLAWVAMAVVIAAAASAWAFAARRRKRGPAPGSAAPPVSGPGSTPPPVAAPPGAYSMTAPAAAYAPPATAQPAYGQVPGAAAYAPSQAAAAPAAPSARHPAPGTLHPVKAVDSVFLIYHDGRLITYFSRSESIKLDDTLDMIRKFVRASFSGHLGRLDSMRYENMNIIMERGNLMYMVVITPLAEYDPVRREMRLLLEEINNRYRVVFKIWDGDFNKVKGVKTMVERFAGEEIAPAPPPAAPQYQPAPSHVPPPVPPGLIPPSQPAPGPFQLPSPRSYSQPAPGQQPAAPHPSPQEPAPLASLPPPTPAKAAPPSQESEGEDNLEAGTETGPQSRPAVPATAPPASRESPPPRKVRGLLEMEDEEEGPAGEIPGPEEGAPGMAPAAKEEPRPPPGPPARPQAAGLSDSERLRLLEDRFLRGEITELTYRELREKLGRK